MSLKPKQDEPKKSDIVIPFIKNYGKMIIATVIATVLWVATNLEFDIEKTFSVPVRYTNLPLNLIITNNPPDKVNLTVKGPRYEIFSFDNLISPMSYDLSSFSKGMSSVQIRTEDISLPRRIKAISTSPSEISIEIDSLTTKTVKINPVLGKLNEGYIIEGVPKISPTRVKIKGPRKLIKQYETIDTRLISLEGEKSNFSIEVPLEPPSDLFSIESAKLVKINVNIKEENLKKEFNNLNVSFKNFETINYKASGQTIITLAFDGPYSHVNKLNSDDISVYVDANDLKNAEIGKHELPIRVDYPNSDSLNLSSVSPKIVEISIN